MTRHSYILTHAFRHYVQSDEGDPLNIEDFDVATPSQDLCLS